MYNRILLWTTYPTQSFFVRNTRIFAECSAGTRPSHFALNSPPPDGASNVRTNRPQYVDPFAPLLPDSHIAPPFARPGSTTPTCPTRSASPKICTQIGDRWRTLCLDTPANKRQLLHSPDMRRAPLVGTCNADSGCRSECATAMRRLVSPPTERRQF